VSRWAWFSLLVTEAGVREAVHPRILHRCSLLLNPGIIYSGRPCCAHELDPSPEANQQDYFDEAP
jgi:hypothetical protein